MKIAVVKVIIELSAAYGSSLMKLVHSYIYLLLNLNGRVQHLFSERSEALLHKESNV